MRCGKWLGGGLERFSPLKALAGMPGPLTSYNENGPTPTATRGGWRTSGLRSSPASPASFESPAAYRA